MVNAQYRQVKDFHTEAELLEIYSHNDKVQALKNLEVWYNESQKTVNTMGVDFLKNCMKEYSSMVGGLCNETKSASLCQLWVSPLL